MINLTGKDLSGLARGVEMFKSVKRADSRLSNETDGILHETQRDLENETCAKCEARRKQGGAGLCAECTQKIIDKNPELQALQKKGKAILDKIGNGESISLDADENYPADVVPNSLEARKNEGIKRGAAKYGERKNSDPICSRAGCGHPQSIHDAKKEHSMYGRCLADLGRCHCESFVGS